MEKLFSGIFYFPPQKKESEQQITKNQKMGGRARSAFLFQFFGQVGNFQKINFPFFHFSIFFWNLCILITFYIDFLRNGPRIGRMDDCR